MNTNDQFIVRLPESSDVPSGTELIKIHKIEAVCTFLLYKNLGCYNTTSLSRRDKMNTENQFIDDRPDPGGIT